MSFSHVGSATFLPAGDKANYVLPRMQAIQHRQIAFARNAECVGDALCKQAVNKKMTGKLGSHALIVPLPAGLQAARPAGPTGHADLFGRRWIGIGTAAFQCLAGQFLVTQRRRAF